MVWTLIGTQIIQYDRINYFTIK